MRKPSTVAITIAIGIVALLSPLFTSRAMLGWGFNLFLFWTALCVAAVLADRMIVWIALIGSAFAFVSIGWLINGPPVVDDWGYGPLDAIALFLGTALVIAATGVLAVMRAAIRQGKGGS